MSLAKSIPAETPPEQPTDARLWDLIRTQQIRAIGQALTPQPGSAEEARLIEYYATAGRYTGD